MKRDRRDSEQGKGPAARLASAARQLAMECLVGTAPDFKTMDEFYDDAPACANGWVVFRAGLRPDSRYSLESPIREALPRTPWGREPWWIVTEANDCAKDKADRNARLVFPLLYLADALDDAPQAPTEPTPSPKASP